MTADEQQPTERTPTRQPPDDRPAPIRGDGGRPPSQRTACHAIVNPESGSGDHLPAVRRLAERRGYSVRETERAGHAIDLAMEAAADGVDTLAACGGDGTLREVIEGLRRADALDEVLVGVVPAGTANVVATDLDIEDAETGFAALDTGEIRRLDLGLAGEESFLKSCIAGLTADASAATTADRKSRFGPLAFVITGIREAATFEPLAVEIDAVGEGGEWEWSGEAACLVIGNTRRFGTRIEQADVEDGLFDVTIVKSVPNSDLVTEAIAQQLLKRDTEHVGKVHARSLEIESAEPIDFSLDGEIRTHDRLDIRMLPGAVSMPVGAEYDPDPVG